MKTHGIIIRTLITEKSSRHQEIKQYTFEVGAQATKTRIKHAIKEIYGVEVDKVRLMITPPKSRMMKRGQEWVKRPKMKKAIVTLKGKKTIDPNKIKEHKK